MSNEHITKKEADMAHRDIWAEINALKTRSHVMEIEQVKVSGMADDLKEIKVTIKDIMEQYVKKEDNKMIRNIIFGLVAIIVMAVVNAWMAQILR